jgi:hypothetical protein
MPNVNLEKWFEEPLAYFSQRPVLTMGGIIDPFGIRKIHINKNEATDIGGYFIP